MKNHIEDFKDFKIFDSFLNVLCKNKTYLKFLKEEIESFKFVYTAKNIIVNKLRQGTVNSGGRIVRHFIFPWK